MVLSSFKDDYDHTHDDHDHVYDGDDGDDVDDDQEDHVAPPGGDRWSCAPDPCQIITQVMPHTDSHTQVLH